MDNNLKIKIIERFDSYYSGINNKGAFLLAFNTFLLGSFIVGYKDLINIIGSLYICVFNLMIGILMICSIISMIYTIISMIPFLDSKSNDERKSVWFFNDIATEDKIVLFERIDNSKEEEITADLNNQIYELSKGLKKKHQFVKIALIFNIFEIIILIPIILIILF